MFNIVDGLVLILIIYLIWQGLRTGFVGGLLNVATTIVSFLLATSFYSYLAGFLSRQFDLSENVAAVIAFLILLIGLETIISFVLAFLYGKIARLYKKSKILNELDKYLGIFPSLAVGLFLITVLMLLVLTLPVKPWLREPIQDSWWGKNIVARGFSFVPVIEQGLQKLPYKNLVYILTPPNPNSEESQKLNIPERITLKEDPQAEMEMFDLVNRERTKVGLKPVKFNNTLRDVGRLHCEDMFKRSYFSHYTPEGKSPFDRMDEAGIDYLAAGENLAYAPSVAIAHQGLMNSKGHRENILRKEFGTLGVGVIDGGLNGKMFCQEFTN